MTYKTGLFAIFVAVSMMTAGISAVNIADAAKPQQTIEISNGFPSGEHHNMNIHGKKDGFSGCDDAGGSSIFTPEYGVGTIEFVSNRKASLDSLTALDKCTESFDGDSAKVQLPYENEGYYVFWRILAKPSNGNTGDPSSVLLYPNMDLFTACNDNDGTGQVIDGFDGFTSCEDQNAEGISPLGVITKDGTILDPDGEELQRFGDSSNGKGKSKAIDITDMFLWTGVACDDTVDLDGDGQITLADFDLTGDGIVDIADMELLGLSDVFALIDVDGDGIIESPDNGSGTDELLELLKNVSGCQVFDEPTWIFTIADLVIHGFDYENNGSKLTQIRFYPVDTTQFIR
ncbi:MAG: hypothetical protein K5793_09310 [Nitrosarchaeum sp.]|nr:hypothetical protein [Nitrosarchaeum sp.]